MTERRNIHGGPWYQVPPPEPPREERSTCPVCEASHPVAGPDGIVRHLLRDHPSAPLSEAISRKLTEFQEEER